MARPGGNPLCVGKKGRSGRKSLRDEALRLRVIEKAWKMKEECLKDAEAIQIVLKDMTDKKDLTSAGEKVFFMPIEILDKKDVINKGNNEPDTSTIDNSEG